MNAIFTRSACLSTKTLRNYAEGKLSGEARFQVENHLLDCQLCSAAVEGYTADRAGSRTAERDIAKLSKAQQKNISRRSNRFVQVLMLIIILGLVAGAYLFYKRYTQVEKWYADYFVPAPNEYLVVRGELKDSIPISLQMALEYYDEGYYAASISFFNEYFETRPNDYTAMRYAGIAQMELRQLPEAIRLLSVVVGNDPEQSRTAGWYLALAYLRNRELATAKSLLDRLRRSPGAYQTRAETLYNQLPK